MNNALCFALDVSDAPAARDLVERLQGTVSIFKIGLELFVVEGAKLVREIARNNDVFLDLKLHDIPNTVRAAARGVSYLGAKYMTTHALGGPSMLRAARAGLDDGPNNSRVKLLAVTILTHHTASELIALGIAGQPHDAVVRLARMAQDAGADGCVCAPTEISAVRTACGPHFIIVTPGIRPLGTELGDQARTSTPAEALSAGANIIVVGRPIKDAPDPVLAAEQINKEILSYHSSMESQ